MPDVAIDTLYRTEPATSWPSFSIVIPTYERRDVVCAAVRALSEIAYPGERELIVVVDGSTDGTAEALRAIECPVPFRIIEQENSGAARARNRGAAEAKNEILLFLDDDMISDPNLLVEHARTYQSGADAVIGDTLLDAGSPPGFLSESIRAWIDASRVGGALSPFDVWAGQLSVRRLVFEELGGFDETFTSDGAFANEDADFGVELLARYRVQHNPAAVSRQRYVVGPRELMGRAPLWASGDLRFVQKHPHLTRELFVARGSARRLTRFVYKPLTFVPFVPSLLARLGVLVADLGLKSRFRSSRTLARFFSVTRSVAYWRDMKSRGWFPTSERLLVLCYHAIQDQPKSSVHNRFTVTREALQQQLDSLSKRGFTFVGPNALAAYLRDDAPMPRRAVLLTFDDGYSDFPTIAREVLKPRGIEALAFPVTGSASGTNDWDRPQNAGAMRLLHSDELRTLPSLGVELGCHSRTHPEMPRLSDDARRGEIVGSRADLTSLGLGEPRFFAYPFGELDDASIDAVRKAGFLAAFGIEARWLTRKSDPFNLPRVVILSSDRGWRFRFKTTAPTIYNWLADPRVLLDYAIRRLSGLLRGH